jgi:hypothetical protein
MPFDTRQAALLRPAAVAVHDDGDVPRQSGGIESRGREALQSIGFQHHRCHQSIPPLAA